MKIKQKISEYKALYENRKNNTRINFYYSFLTFLLTIDAVLSLTEKNSINGKLFLWAYVSSLLLFLILSIGRVFKNDRPNVCHNINFIFSLCPIVLAILAKHIEMSNSTNYAFILFQVFLIIWVIVVMCDLTEFIYFYLLSELKPKIPYIVIFRIIEIAVLVLAIYYGYFLSSSFIKVFPLFEGIQELFSYISLGVYILVLPLVIHEQLFHKDHKNSK